MREDILRIKLQKALEEKYPDYLTMQEVGEVCLEAGRKISNSERRFRKDNRCPGCYIPHEKVWNEKRTAIIGYRALKMVDVPIAGTLKDGKIIMDTSRQNQLFRPGFIN